MNYIDYKNKILWRLVICILMFSVLELNIIKLSTETTTSDKIMDLVMVVILSVHLSLCLINTVEVYKEGDRPRR